MEVSLYFSFHRRRNLSYLLLFILCNFFPLLRFFVLEWIAASFLFFCYLIFVLRFFLSSHFSDRYYCYIQYNLLFLQFPVWFMFYLLFLLPLTYLCSFLPFSRPTFLFSIFLPSLLLILNTEVSSTEHASCSL